MRTIKGIRSGQLDIYRNPAIAISDYRLDNETDRTKLYWEIDVADQVIALEGKDDQAIEPHNFEYEFRTKSGYPIKFYSDDSSAEFYYITNEFGITFIAQANGESAAWECFIDESKPIEQSELYEAYGFDSQAAMDAVNPNNEDGNWPELIEGYEYQSNSTGTGIVDVGHYTSYPALLTIAEMKRFEIIMIIKLGDE